MTNIFNIYHYRLRTKTNSFLKAGLAQKKVCKLNFNTLPSANSNPNLPSNINYFPVVHVAISKSVNELETNKLNIKSRLIEETFLKVLTYLIIKKSKSNNQIYKSK
ncbi:hypothetical protein CLV55_101492 [Flavobacterium aciduliphilum]|jgi:hypothetical protein|uniref:Uncharacterized protein n=1 Tax=Flavobacterium aciduliphilum TaxID=1101402 RepID=A0A328YZ06_9FLAO|nr:hypothetical protein CLV55_101492 [Flavobacterium aciduliphilum]